MKQTTLTQRLLSALVALCMVLSVCAPALAAEPGRASAAVIYYQKDGGKKTLLDALSIKTLMPGYKITFVRNLIIITMGSTEHTGELDGVTLSGNGSDPYNFELCTAGTNWVTDIRSSSNIGLTITGMKNVTVTPAKGSSIGFLGSLKIVDCTGDVNIQNSSSAAVVGRLEVDNSAGHGGSVTITENCDREDWGTYLPYGTTITSNGPVKIENKNGCAVCGSLEIKESASVDIKGTATNGRAAILGSATISSNGPVKIENQTSNDWKAGAAVGYKDDPNITGTILEVKKSASVEVIGAGVNPTLGGWASIKSSGDVSITNSLGGSAVGRGLTVTTGGAVTVTGDNDATIKSTATITAGRNVSIQNETGIAVGGKLIVNSSTGVTVVGNTQKNAVRYEANITSSGAVNISNDRGIAVGGGLNVNSSTGVTVTGSRASEPIITGNSTIKNTNKVEIINNEISGKTAQNITYTPPAGKGYFYQTTQNGSKLHTRSAISSTTPYLCIEPDTLYTLTLSEDVTATTGGTKDTKFYAGESVTVTAPADTETTKFEKWTGGENITNVEPTDWRTKGTFTFTMPAGNVTLGASYHTITKYEVKVTGGTIVDKNEPGKIIGFFEPGDEVKVAFTGSTGIEDQFEKWTGGENIIKADPADWQSKPSFSFTMPAGNVTLKAECKTVYNVSVADSRGTVLVNNEERSRALEGETVTVKASDTFFNAYHQFNGWSLSDDSAQMVNPSEGWKTSKEFTFKMPAGNVTLKADYKQLYDLAVTGGTIVDENGDTGETTGIYLPGTEVTIQFTDSHDIAKQFKQWKSTDTEPEAPTAGWPEGGWQTSKEFTFKMPEGNVTLEAEYKTVYNVSVDENRGTVLVNDEERTQALEGETVTVKASDTFFDAYREFDGWKLTSSTPLVRPSDNWENSKEFTFTMPAGNVTLTANYKQLYDLTVNGGTIVDENGDTGETTGIYLPGTEVTIQFTESDEITEQFKQWTGGENITEADPNWQTSKKFTFEMPTGNVSLSAEYRKTYLIYETAGVAEFFVDGKQVNQAPAGVRVTVKLVDGFNNDHREFDQWQPGVGTALVDPEEGWKHKPSFSFTMPEGDVELQAHTTSLYDVNVTHGTIVDGTGDTGASQKIVKPGQLVTVRAESTEENPFLRWNSTGKAPVEPDDGWPEGGWQTSKEFTFKMPNGNVTLEAQRDQLYKVSINDSLGSVTINGEPRSSLWVKEGETVTVATTLKDGYWMEFEKWNSTGTAPEEPEGGWTETNKSTSTTFTFKMPNGPVELVAQWSASSLDPYQPIDPDEPLDEDFGVEPDTTGGTIAAVAVGGAAIWGGYEIATRVILHNLLPEGAAIPANRGQLALLVWNTAGRPEPAGAPAFADVTDPDMAKAAQWCTEQGTMGAKGDRFEPEGWTPKFKVIEVWNKAFPAA